MSKWADDLKREALELALKKSIREAADKTGVPAGTIKRWRFEKRTTNKGNKPNRTDKPKVKAQKSMGRPSKYKDEYTAMAYKLCLLGATDKDMADFFDVDEATINRWKERYPKFRESLKEGKDQADGVIASKLFHRAAGYSHPEDKIFNNNGEPLVVPTMKHYPPDTTAAIFWLKNRQPSKWRDRVETEHSGVIVNLIDNISDDDEENRD